MPPSIFSISYDDNGSCKRNLNSKFESLNDSKLPLDC